MSFLLFGVTGGHQFRKGAVKGIYSDGLCPSSSMHLHEFKEGRKLVQTQAGAGDWPFKTDKGSFV